MFLYLDEAGDLGFNFNDKMPSVYFVITLLVCNNRKASESIKKATEKTVKNKLHAVKKYRTVNELKGAQSHARVKRYFFKQIEKIDDWSVYSIVLNKKDALRKLSQPINVHRIYNVLANHLLKQVDFSFASTVNLFVDRSKDRDGITEFDTMLQTSLDTILPLNVPLSITHMDSCKSYGIQAVDLLCWGIFRKYEIKDDEWYEMFKHRTVYEQRFLA